MCVEIVKPEETISYKLELPLEEQICNCSEVLIDCDSNCDKVHKFLDEVEKACQCGKNLAFTIKLENSSDLQLFRKTKRLNKEIAINDIISKVSLLYKKADDKLKEISDSLKN